MEISEHLLVVTVWNLMSTTAVSTLKRGFSACKEAEGEAKPSVKESSGVPGRNSSVCSIFPDSLLLAAPLLMAEGPRCNTQKQKTFSKAEKSFQLVSGQADGASFYSS